MATATKPSRQTAHTPGPWEIHDNIGRKSELGIVADAAPCIIAVMGNAKAWPAEARANARLIAAAPDLLAACQRIVDCEDKQPGANCEACVKLARAAIARATSTT